MEAERWGKNIGMKATDLATFTCTGLAGLLSFLDGQPATWVEHILSTFSFLGFSSMLFMVEDGLDLCMC